MASTGQTTQATPLAKTMLDSVDLGFPLDRVLAA